MKIHELSLGARLGLFAACGVAALGLFTAAGYLAANWNRPDAGQARRIAALEEKVQSLGELTDAVSKWANSVEKSSGASASLANSAANVLETHDSAIDDLRLRVVMLELNLNLVSNSVVHSVARPTAAGTPPRRGPTATAITQ